MTKSNWFQRFLLPGFAFKAVIIGGGYATGRELAEFFGPHGIVGGLYGMLVATLVWSVMCMLTFLYARAIGAGDYRTFFRHLLGRFWPLFEILFITLLTLMLAVFSAASGAIGFTLFGAPEFVGQLVFVTATAGFVAFGNEVVEQLFKYVSFALYGTYAIFLVLSLTQFGSEIVAGMGEAPRNLDWVGGGFAYAGYNIVGAVLVLSVLRHFTSAKDAAVAGLLCGPLAMLPAALFFLSLAAFPAAMNATLPSDYVLERLGSPAFKFAYQAMIFLAMLESAVGGVHAINERIAGAYGREDRPYTPGLRFAVAIAILIIAGFAAGYFGLVALIANGYRYISYGVLAVFVAPMLTVGAYRVIQWQRGKTVSHHPAG